MKKYFRIIKNSNGDTYSLVLQSWEKDENGKEINNDGLKSTVCITKIIAQFPVGYDSTTSIKLWK